LTAYSSFQSGQISDGEEIVFPENYEDDDSHDTPPQVDEVADPLIKQPVFYLPTRDTVDSQTSSFWAVDIPYFFVVHGQDETMQKRVCKLCRQVFVQYANDCFVNGILARNMASRRFQMAWQTTSTVWLPHI